MKAKLTQTRKGIVSDELAISNLIATLILIAVAVVGGAFAYTAFRGQAQSTTTGADLRLQSVSAENVGDTLYTSAAVKNTGTLRLDSVSVIINPPSGPDSIDLDIGTLNPGQTGSTSSDTGSLKAGEVYVVQITANTPDDGGITKTTTVRVES